ncbi:amidohydrolase family protein [Frankia sp. CNm7]|uniref:Amidohydrolase family protein n=1 Tax=Frankia nepalensis TaxID=1836974 RepID=A0A937URJ1_9ACTN|nr:amidohydrolase family protein [Frankia nepalensis]MBL7498464.1 amidohydrolase family protein [Frankia nepalensis]MBL7509485.1 amidohydrolase family protein [Frankia nepalensis]MBL7520744.1 amidohydrolase family protein [Frankia nepalensis]MBL7629295.1 amidohydrolase family protein [Frankia nepalensis]
MARSVSRRSLLAGITGGMAGAAVGVIGSAPAGAASSGAAGGAEDVVAVRGVTVIDGVGGVRRDQNVLVRAGRVLDAGHHHRVPVPHGARVVDGNRRFLIPGLADMHTHATEIDPTDPELYVVNGVTTTRQMSSSEAVRGWRRDIDAGRRLGPSWTVGSEIIDGAPSLWEGSGLGHAAVADAAQARAAVRQQHAAGADFIKTYTRLSRESFHAIAAESKRLGIAFVGHVPDFVQVTEASDAGLGSIEHLFEFWYDISRDEERLRAEIARVHVAGGDYAGWFTGMHPFEYAAARGYDRGKAARVFDRLARNGTRVTPTLSVHRTCDVPDDIPRDDPRFQYVSADTLGYWQWATENVYLRGRTPQESTERRELFGRRLRLAGELAKAGVPLMAGTDLGTSYLIPGFSLHDELALLVQAGLTPARALGAATLEPARHLGQRDRGAVARGNVADLVLLDADPLADIRNTTRINSVFVRGRLIDPDGRRRMLADIKAAVASRPATGVVPAAAGCACHGVHPRRADVPRLT